MQFLGLFGIYVESYKIIIKWRRIFSQITLSLILPLSFIFLAHISVSALIFSKIVHNEFRLRHFPTTSLYHKRLSELVRSEWAVFWTVKIVYFIFLLIFSLLSTSAVVYTIACIYTSREITFKKIMSVVPKVWKRLMVTFLCAFLAFFLYFVLLVGALVLWSYIDDRTQVGLPILVILLILYAIGFVYMTIIWHLASVVSVLEDSYGFRAMIKSKNLIKGKLWIAVVVFVKLTLSLIGIRILFDAEVLYTDSIGIAGRIGIAVLCFLLIFKLFLFGLVIQTVIYFVCKSYHHENIDKSALSDHLEVIYLGEYVPLKASRDVQLEQFRV